MTSSAPSSRAASVRRPRERGLELPGRTLGIVGCGAVGQVLARLGLGFGMNVIAFDPFPAQDFFPGEGFSYSTMDELLLRSDVISLHCPPLKERFVIGKDELKRAKRGVFLINTARGYAVDAYATEPPTDRRIVSHPAVISTPHIGGNTEESVDRAMEIAVKQLLEVLGER